MNKLLRAAACLLLALPAAAAAPRTPAAAGRFYPADPAELGRLVDGLLAGAPAPALAGEPVALLVPHAGLEYSGAVAAEAFRALEGRRYDDVVIIGTGHYKALEGAAIYPGAYAEPEGGFEYDEALAKRIAARSPLVVFDAGAHKKEHSIEVELPFLRRAARGAKLVALVMNTQDLDAARAIGRAVAAAAKGRRVLLIASSDQSHYPPARVASAVDATTLAALERLSPAYFWFTNRLLGNRRLPNLAVTYCGEGAVTAVLTAALDLGADRFELLDRSDSSRSLPEGDKSRVVGYASGVFTKGAGRAAAKPLSAEARRTLLALARRAAGAQARGQKPPVPGLADEPALNLPAAVFVTLRKKKGGALRGCVGTTQAQAPLNEAVAKAAADAAAADPRFSPVAPDELDGLSIEVSVLSEPAPVSVEALKPGQGAVLERDDKRGVFLPQVWEELKDKTRLLEELCAQKAGLEKGCWKDPRTRLSAFSVEAFSE